MSRANWSKLGGGRLCRDCRDWPELRELARELAWTEAEPLGSGPRRRGAACGWTAPEHGTQTRGALLAGLPEA